MKLNDVAICLRFTAMTCSECEQQSISESPLALILNMLVILATRAWAIWDRSRRILVFLIVLAIVRQRLFTIPCLDLHKWLKTGILITILNIEQRQIMTVGTYFTPPSQSVISCTQWHRPSLRAMWAYGTVKCWRTRLSMRGVFHILL